MIVLKKFVPDSRGTPKTTRPYKGSSFHLNFNVSGDITPHNLPRRGSSFHFNFNSYCGDTNLKSKDEEFSRSPLLKPSPSSTNEETRPQEHSSYPDVVVDGLDRNISDKEKTTKSISRILRPHPGNEGNVSHKTFYDATFRDINIVPAMQETAV